MKIESLSALEILDSRGRPTLRAYCQLVGGRRHAASVPSGASTGAAEAMELRDKDPERYGGRGCRKAAANVSGPVHDALAGREFGSQADFDGALIDLDGTEKKSHLGANAILAVSLAFARAAAAEREQELFRYFGSLLEQDSFYLPRLTINLFSGGLHAGRQVAVQDVLLVPLSAKTIDESLVHTSRVYHAAAALVEKRYGMRLLTADEGGLAPPFASTDEMFATTVEAIEDSGLEPGRDMAIAADVASSHFFSHGYYEVDGGRLSASEMRKCLQRWSDQYPLVSIEDGLAEDDWENWPALCRDLGSDRLIVGDDLLCTKVDRISRAVNSKACNALLLKVNQVGTLTEAAKAFQCARAAGWQVTVSVRSGDTGDDWAADLAVGWSGNQFKPGSVTQSERLEKYNRLLEIEHDHGFLLRGWME